ncbi:unnamed protein product [Cyprideis torosa]|uniref:Uncharacterized protein n=1 Tax=Cyprideis torosa TaxID=163714 RepID=A0A7R8ZGM9_9CRUS|nr:unnamed protein product [Cyprideis torosa]CAG0880484.1 unnamed protein product [Cyprideis torosa]
MKNWAEVWVSTVALRFGIPVTRLIHRLRLYLKSIVAVSDERSESAVFSRQYTSVYPSSGAVTTSSPTTSAPIGITKIPQASSGTQDWLMGSSPCTDEETKVVLSLPFNVHWFASGGIVER